MSVQSPFILPLSGLGQGIYQYDLTVDDDFFASFPDAPIQQATVVLQLTVDKQARQMILDFNFSGTVRTDCDRCLAAVDFPIEDQGQLVVKFSTEAASLEEEGELIYLHPDTSLFNVAPYAYELVVLALPMIKTFACREGAPPYPCDEDLLSRIDQSVDDSSDVSTKDNDDDKPSPWDALKDFK
ncbi:MAG: DUF177 domain-containing protein [Bacteroidota bacterium]